jgi:hypothetical protein
LAHWSVSQQLTSCSWALRACEARSPPYVPRPGENLLRDRPITATAAAGCGILRPLTDRWAGHRRPLAWRVRPAAAG